MNCVYSSTASAGIFLICVILSSLERVKRSTLRATSKAGGGAKVLTGWKVEGLSFAMLLGPLSTAVPRLASTPRQTRSNMRSLPQAELLRHGCQPQGERHCAQRNGRFGHTAVVCAA